MNRGFIKASNEFVLNNWAAFAIIFTDFRPTHVEYRHWEGNVWYYYGVSESFDKAKEGEEIPQYEVVFTMDGNKVTWKWRRV